MSRRKIIKSAKLHGLQLTDNAITFLLKKTSAEGDSTLVDRLLQSIDTQSLRDSCLDVAVLEKTLQSLLSTEQDIVDSTIGVISAFDVPKWTFDPNLKAFRQEEERKGMFGSAQARTEMFRDRFNLVWQRINRNALFVKPVLPTDSLRREYHSLTQIHSLRGNAGEVKTVLGILTQPEEGFIYLEDLTDSVLLDLSEATRTSGLFTEGCVVIARGVLDDNDVFCVSELGFPPAEPRDETFDNISVVGVTASEPDFYGAGLPAATLERIHEAAVAADDTIVFLSDVRLDVPIVFKKLIALFDGYIDAGFIPRAFVLIGNFCSPERDDAVYRLAEAMQKLGTELGHRPILLANSSIILVPGPSDPGGTSVRALPNVPLPEFILASLPPRVRSSITLATNPCRLRLGKQEIVVFREDIVEKMRRNCVVPPVNDASTTEASQHLVKTLLDEAHLCPLALASRPVSWNYDHSLYLYPVPHVVVLADRFSQYEHTYDGCLALNPGSFPTDFSFLAYSVANNGAEFCVVMQRDDEDESEDDVDDNSENNNANDNDNDDETVGNDDDEDSDAVNLDNDSAMMSEFAHRSDDDASMTKRDDASENLPENRPTARTSKDSLDNGSALLDNGGDLLDNGDDALDNDKAASLVAGGAVGAKRHSHVASSHRSTRDREELALDALESIDSDDGDDDSNVDDGAAGKDDQTENENNLNAGLDDMDVLEEIEDASTSEPNTATVPTQPIDHDSDDDIDDKTPHLRNRETQLVNEESIDDDDDDDDDDNDNDDDDDEQARGVTLDDLDETAEPLPLRELTVANNKRRRKESSVGIDDETASK